MLLTESQFRRQLVQGRFHQGPAGEREAVCKGGINMSKKQPLPPPVSLHEPASTKTECPNPRSHSPPAPIIYSRSFQPCRLEKRPPDQSADDGFLFSRQPRMANKEECAAFGIDRLARYLTSSGFPSPCGCSAPSSPSPFFFAFLASPSFEFS